MATAAAEKSNAPEQDSGTEQKKPNPGKRRFLLLCVAVIVVLAGLGVWAWHEFYGQWSEETDDAYVNGNVVEITPLATGTVISIAADDGDLVREGQVLLRFDPSDAQVGLQSAEANLGKAVRQVRGLYSNVDGMKAQLAAQRAEVQKAQDNYNRRRNLAASGAISQEELSHARDDLTSAQSALNNVQQQLSSTSALVDDTIISSHPDVKAAARRSSPMRAPRWLHRSPATLPSAPCSWASAYSQALRPWRSFRWIRCGSTPTSRKPNWARCVSVSRSRSAPTCMAVT